MGARTEDWLVKLIEELFRRKVGDQKLTGVEVQKLLRTALRKYDCPSCAWQTYHVDKLLTCQRCGSALKSQPQTRVLALSTVTRYAPRKLVSVRGGRPEGAKDKGPRKKWSGLRGKILERRGQEPAAIALELKCSAAYVRRILSDDK